MIANSPYVLVVTPKLPAKNVAELIALARSKPGTLNYGSAGPASLAHLAGALFGSLSNIAITHVPYKSTAQSVVDLISGRLDMQFATIAPTLSNIREGQLRALAITGRQRVEALPDTPTMEEAGVPGYEATLWFALVAPAKLPANLAARLNREAVAILNSGHEERARAAGLHRRARPARSADGANPRRHRQVEGGHPEGRDQAGVMVRPLNENGRPDFSADLLRRRLSDVIALPLQGVDLAHRLFSSAARSNGFCSTMKPWRMAS